MARVTLERSPAHCDEVAANLWDFAKDEAWTDFSISVGNTRLPCHRVVLAANSPMLRAAITSDMTERRTGVISLDFSVDVMEVVLQYMYMGEVTMESRLLKDLLKAANYLQMEVLKQQCIDLIEEHINITPENVISWCQVALQFDLYDITAQCSHIAATSFSEVIQTWEFLALGANEIHYYFDLVQEEVLEDSLLEAALAWAAKNKEKRAPCLEVLLKLIELKDCSQKVLREQADLHAELLESSPEVLTLLLNASVVENRQQSNMKQTKKHRTIHKKISERLVVIGGNDVNGMNRDCWYLNLKTHRMTKFTEMPADYCYLLHSVCKTPDGFVVTGGRNSDICAKYITTTGTWVCLQNMPVKRASHGSIWINEKLYVIGGWIWGSEKSQETYRVDFLSTEGIWQQGPALPRKVSKPLVASIDDRSVYVLDTRTGLLYVLDLSQPYSRGWRDWFGSVWKQRASVPKDWCSLADGMTATNDGLYMYSESSNTFSYYSPHSDIWWKAISPTLKHRGSPLVHFEDKLYLMGYNVSPDQCNEVEEYDSETQSWRKPGLRFNKDLIGHHAMVLNIPAK